MISDRLLRGSGLLVVTIAIIVSANRSSRTQQRDWRARFTAAALQIPFDSERTPVSDTGVPAGAVPDSAPHMEIASARTRDTGRVARLEARITSQAAYPRLGIAAGVNYVWKEFAKDTLRLLVIPVDPTKKVFLLSVAPHTHSPPRKVPRLLVVQMASARRGGTPDSSRKTAFTMAICTGDCKPRATWCIARDTLRSISGTEALPSITELRKFFLRNKVVLPDR